MKKIYVALAVTLQLITTLFYFAIFKMSIQLVLKTKGDFDLTSLAFIVFIALILQLLSRLLSKHRPNEVEKAISIAHTPNNKYGWFALLFFIITISVLASFMIEDNLKQILSLFIIIPTGLIFSILIFKKR